MVWNVLWMSCSLCSWHWYAAGFKPATMRGSVGVQGLMMSHLIAGSCIDLPLRNFQTASHKTKYIIIIPYNKSVTKGESLFGFITYSTLSLVSLNTETCCQLKKEHINHHQAYLLSLCVMFYLTMIGWWHFSWQGAVIWIIDNVIFLFRLYLDFG